jgi:hypothetical protein
VDVEDWGTVKVLLAAIAVLGLVIKVLVDFLKSRKAAVPCLTADQITAAVKESIAAALKDVKPITATEANTLLRTTAKDMVEGLVAKVPCFAQHDDCAQKIKEHLAAKSRPGTMPPHKR